MAEPIRQSESWTPPSEEAPRVPSPPAQSIDIPALIDLIAPPKQLPMPEHVPAEVFPVSEYLRDELEARGWTAADLVCGKRLPLERVQAILAGADVRLSEVEALALSLSVSPLLLLNLQQTWHKCRPKEE